jgi:hypothetical protein
MTLPIRLRKLLVLLILVGLILIEPILLVEFLPYKWGRAIDEQSERIFPGRTYAPHPDIDWEFELDFRKHPLHRAVVYGVLGTLALVDAFLIAITWRGYIRLKSTA